jgi:hypothetical protein
MWESSPNGNSLRFAAILAVQDACRRVSVRQTAPMGTVADTSPLFSNRRASAPSPQNHYNSSRVFDTYDGATDKSHSSFATGRQPAAEKLCQASSTDPTLATSGRGAQE